MGMYVILMGAQGSGKGTQADRVAPRLHLARIATGDLFRAAIAAGTPLGREVQAIYDRGELIPDAITLDLVEQRLAEIAAAQARGEDVQGALFAGFPRNRAQAEGLDAALAARGAHVTAVVVLVVPYEELVERLGNRVVCSTCGTVYNLRDLPPGAPETCAACGGVLTRRADDTPDAIKKRLDLYFAETEPLLAYYRERGVLAEVDGNRPKEVVTDEIVAAIDRIGGQPGS